MKSNFCNNMWFYHEALKAVILASDCNPRWLKKHIPTLASSRRVPVILVKDNKRSSLRLGQVVKLKTTLAIGIKVNSLLPLETSLVQ
ncbi:hypothetical protein Cni_G22350 [Canna indica]|uniref:Ribosomal protein eL8/eL30/eS12/Gadd45 domain-containing protein n=1 Tax=Canna indica TaxID=4628 RepID=A0AAQ3KSI9_9LILI|nr:hypothetical protein Cni_G22350 [Canna indica]